MRGKERLTDRRTRHTKRSERDTEKRRQDWGAEPPRAGGPAAEVGVGEEQLKARGGPTSETQPSGPQAGAQTVTQTDQGNQGTQTKKKDPKSSKKGDQSLRQDTRTGHG